MKIAFLFPGQGAQYVGMGKDIYEEYEEARNIYDKASKILNIDMKKLCFETSIEELSKTENIKKTAVSICCIGRLLQILFRENIEKYIVSTCC